jgi:protein-disulfide isomerase
MTILTIHCQCTSLSALTIDTTNQPTLGSPDAPVHVVAFLEPKCPDSKKYSNTSFSKLKSDFIDTNKVSYTVITASFLSQSMPAAIALLCVYNQEPNPPRTKLFFEYLDYIYKHQPPERENWATIETLQKFAAKANPAINPTLLKNCIENGHYKSQIEKNTTYGDSLMGRISTPTIYVNGVKVENKDETIDYDTLKNAIEEALKQKS